jgi:hypothetical protein
MIYSIFSKRKLNPLLGYRGIGLPRISTKHVFTIFACLLPLHQTSAASILILNHSFEEAALAAPNTFENLATSWVRDSASGFGRFEGGGDFGQNASPTHGNQIAFLNSDIGDAHQTLSENFAASTNYVFTIDMSARDIYGTNHAIEFSLYADGILSNVVGLQTYDGTQVANDIFNTYTFTITAAQVATANAIDKSIGIRFRGIGTSDGDFDLDNVRLESNLIPEPSTSIICSLALIGVIMRRQRYR